MIKELYYQYLEEKALYKKLYKEYLNSNVWHNQIREQDKKVTEIIRELDDVLNGKIFEIEEGRFIKVESTEYCGQEVNIFEQYKEG